MIVFANGQPKTSAVNLAQATIVYHEGDAPLVKQMAQVLADDIGRVSGTRPGISTRKVSGAVIAIGTVVKTGRHRELRGAWERYAIDTRDGNVVITGSDARGLAYGVLHVSEAIGVSPWYWFADIPIDKTNKHVYEYAENYVSPSPSVKYRGIFINDEDWGLKTWAAQTFEKGVGRYRSQDLRPRLRTDSPTEGQYACPCHAFLHRRLLFASRESEDGRQVGHHDYHQSLRTVALQQCSPFGMGQGA
jgi:hypothetical protein